MTSERKTRAPLPPTERTNFYALALLHFFGCDGWGAPESVAASELVRGKLEAAKLKLYLGSFGSQYAFCGSHQLLGIGDSG